ncbi:hypothetical protein BDV95DRAFT_542850 [Massariosphaeria phaeospora]|uniref:Uncharacterized protein n=1 Tax=Massariosphaeria phaeospora TaxID=100035 RepID=A0A7C8MBC6_9PLEO|nr:hypothetical protein BDV95DRAFT_542850 [Massariosphaeria phaeospora]
MSSSDSTTSTALLVTFGIFTLLTTIAGIHYRDSLCCLFYRSLHGAWSQQVDSEVEIRYGSDPDQDNDLEDGVYEMQPRLSLPLYLDFGGDGSAGGDSADAVSCRDFES